MPLFHSLTVSMFKGVGERNDNLLLTSGNLLTCDRSLCVNCFKSCSVTLKSSSAHCSTQNYPEIPQPPPIDFPLCCWTAQLLSDSSAVAVWLRSIKRLIDTSWALWAWEEREYTELLRAGVAQIIYRKSLWSRSSDAATQMRLEWS